MSISVADLRTSVQGSSFFHKSLHLLEIENIEVAIAILWKIPKNRKKVISPPLDYWTRIAETTQSRQVLRINLNKVNEVKALSAVGEFVNLC